MFHYCIEVKNFEDGSIDGKYDDFIDYRRLCEDGNYHYNIVDYELSRFYEKFKLLYKDKYSFLNKLSEYVTVLSLTNLGELSN